MDDMFEKIMSQFKLFYIASVVFTLIFYVSILIIVVSAAYLIVTRLF